MINSSKAAETQIAANVQNLITAKGVTRKHVIDTARMSRTTFDRAMSGARSFTIEELMGVANALGVTPDKLLPTEWVDSNQQAA